MARYSQIKLYKDMKKALAPSKVTPIKYATATPTSLGSKEAVLSYLLKEGFDAYEAKQKKDAEAADIKAAGAMADKYHEPQKEWNEDEYGSTPDTLRAAPMPGALTENAGATYNPNVKPFPEQWAYDGEEGQQLSMNDALGAPNAALGSPLDPGQPYAVGTDEEGDDANWMSAPEHAEFYKRAAAEAQTRFDAENLTGLPAVMEADRGGAYNTANGVRGQRSNAMLAALRGEDRALEREEAERDRTLAETIDAERRKQANAMALEAYKRKNGGNAKYSNSLVWGTDENGKSVLMQSNTAGGKLRVAELPPGITARRGKISSEDLGDKIAIFDANGQFIGYRGKGLAQKRVINNKTLITLPAVPGKISTSNGNNQTSSATATPNAVKTEPLPVTDKQLASQINSQIRPMVEARKTGRLALDLIDANKDDVIPMSGTWSKIASWNSDSDQGILLSYIENLKSPNVLGAMMALKEASATGSTGFGQLNIKELDILINRLGALNAEDTNVGVLRRSIVSVNDSFDSVVNMVKKNVSEEKLKELELHELFYPPNSSRVKTDTNASPVPDAAKEDGVTQEMWNAMSPKDRGLFQ